MRRLFYSMLCLMALFLNTESFAMMHYHQPSLSQAMRLKLSLYKEYSYRALMPYLHHAGLAYPPKKIAFLIFKQNRRLELWAQGYQQNAWHHIKDFKVLAASGHAGPKLKSGDQQVPEGIYQIVGFNPQSHFNLSMHVNYPNEFDLNEAKKSRRSDLGNDIFIHGKQSSIGCIAIGDKNIEQLFVLAYYVGMKNIEVIIAPNDFRKEQPIYNRHDPKWVPLLYADIKQALKPFVLTN